MQVSDVAGRILAGLLEARTGQQLTMSRRWRIETALKSLMRERGLDTLEQLISAIVAERESALADAVVEALLNNETFFFRDRPAFDLLLRGALPRLAKARARERKLSIWCAGCSTGQEAYSLAMTFAEEKARWDGWTIDIVATDVSAAAIGQAKAGLYSQFEVQRGLGVFQMMRWFEEVGTGQWRISEAMRSAVRFRTHSIADPAPQPGKFDLILCRNLLLYFADPMRRKAFDRLAAASRTDTMLMLGAGETVIGQTEAFVSDTELRGLYVRSDASAGAAEPRRRHG
jgi:chemotaxis protein methyltransferase CheR